MFKILRHPEFAKELAEEHQRELLEEAQVERLLQDPNLVEDDYVPVTTDEDELIPPRRENTHIKKN